MRVLVTGASGSLGNVLRESLSSQPLTGEDAVMVEYWSSPRDESNSDDERIDLRDEEAVKRGLTLSRPDTIVHLAALAGPDSERDPAFTQLINVDAVEILAREARANGAGLFVFASSSAVYGDRGSSPVTENVAPAPISVYGRTKLEAESRLEAVASQTGLTVVCLRIFNIYGPQFHSALITRLLASTVANPVELRGGQAFVRDYVSSADVVEVIRRSIGKKWSTPFQCINLGSGIPVSNSELPLLLAPAKIHYVTRPGTSSYSCADIDRLAAELDYRPAGVRLADA